MKRYIIDKLDTDYTETETESYINDTEETTTQDGGRGRFQSIIDTHYAKPRRGSKQENFTKDEIKEKLVGFTPLQTMKDKEILKRLPVFKTWVRYINKDTRQFRTGGLLMKVSYPDYIMLVNTRQNVTWSVQLKDNIIFIRDPSEAETRRETISDEKQKEKAIKNKLYEYYQQGVLELRKK